MNWRMGRKQKDIDKINCTPYSVKKRMVVWSINGTEWKPIMHRQYISHIPQYICRSITQGKQDWTVSKMASKMQGRGEVWYHNGGEQRSQRLRELERHDTAGTQEREKHKICCNDNRESKKTKNGNHKIDDGG